MGYEGVGPSAHFGASALGKDQPFGPCPRTSHAGILFVEAGSSGTDLGKGKTMFEGLVSRQERNQLLDELCGDLNSSHPMSMGDALDGFAFEADVPFGDEIAASSNEQPAA